MKCIFCNQEIAEDSRFCDKCGKMVPRCPTCGKVITRRIRFCGRDGTAIPEEVLALLPDEMNRQTVQVAETAEPAEMSELPEARDDAAEVKVAEECAEADRVPETVMVELQETAQPQPIAESQEPVQPQSIAEPQDPIQPHPAVEEQEAIQPHPAVEEQEAIQPQPAMEAQVAVQPIAEPQPSAPRKKRGGLVFLFILFILVAMAVGAGFGYAAANGKLPFPAFQADSEDQKGQEDGQKPSENDLVLSGEPESMPETEESSQMSEGTQDPGQEADAASDMAESMPSQEAQTQDGFQDGSQEGAAVGEASAPVQEEVDPLTDFILNCDNRYFTMEELEGLDADMCRIARNGIYARMGRKFNDETLQAFFSQFEWYEPSIEAGDFQENMLNEYQIFNRDLIVEYEKAKGYR